MSEHLNNVDLKPTDPWYSIISHLGVAASSVKLCVKTATKKPSRLTTKRQINSGAPTYYVDVLYPLAVNQKRNTAL